MNKTCFVAQPFDRDKFDKRYSDVFEPAIEKAGLKPYRVDKDPSVRIPIDEIEKGIRDAEVVFVDITLDNPNVWYELGFASACKKDTLIVCCTDERPNKFPFDIQHRSVLTYKTSSKSDFDALEKSITEKIKAFLSSSKVVENIVKAPINELQGLEGYEVAMLVIILERQLTARDSISLYILSDQMDKAGYNPIATSVGLRTLEAKKMIETINEVDPLSGDEYPACRVTMKGEDWILQNQQLISFAKPPKK